MRSKIMMAILIMTVFSITLIQAQKVQFQREGDAYVTQINKEYSVKPGGNLKISNVAGDIKVNSWNNNQVKIVENLKIEVYTQEEAQKTYEKILAGYQQTGNDVIVEGIEGRNWIKRNFQINVPKEFNLDLQTSGGDLEIASIKGLVELKTSGGDIQILEVTGNVEAKTSGGDLKLEKIDGNVVAKTSGGDVDLMDLSGAIDVKTSGGDITLVGGKKEIDLKTSGGSIDVRNVTGTLSAKTSGGDIEAGNCDGNLALHTSGGDIQLQNLKGTIEAHTSGGDIDGNTLSESVNLHTSGGGITLKNVQGALEAKTSGGDIDVEITTTDFSKPHGVQLHTSGGNIDLTLPAKIPATILAEIQLGRSSQLKRYDIYSDFQLTKNTVEEDGNKIIRGQGEINGGGDQILLKTSGGNIRIHKK
ncbi:DUF4097 family beta strand repeat protein [candidate division KSB1 bacterium]|nr:DUF4097 family beta strand repeat protein [candidate division KSB1 bacterium]